MKRKVLISVLAFLVVGLAAICLAQGPVTIGELSSLNDIAQNVDASGVQVFSLDKYLWAFLQANMFSILFFLALLKVFATFTPYSEDDKIVEALIGFFGQFKPGPKQNTDKPAGS